MILNQTIKQRQSSPVKSPTKVGAVKGLPFDTNDTSVDSFG